jgi:signal transduction histidine kinase
MTTLHLPSFGADIRDRLRQNFQRWRKHLPGVHSVSRLQGKLIIPYVILTLVLAAVGIYVVTRLVASTIRERFVNQIYESARVASDAIVRQERTHLENLRLMVYTEGVGDTLGQKDANRLEALLLPLAMNSGIDAATVVDINGIELITLGKDPETGLYIRSQGKDFSAEGLVSLILEKKTDTLGDKYAGLLDTNYGPGFFTSSPVFDTQGNLVGTILVGTRLNSMLANIKAQSSADLLILDTNHKVVATTLAPPEDGFGSLEEASQDSLSDGQSTTHDIQLYRREFQVTYTPFKARGQLLGWLGVVLPSSYVVAAEATSRNTFSLIFTLGTVGVIVIGLLLSQSIAQPILKLRTMTQAVAAGNLEESSGLNRTDEIGDLAEAFDVMTLRLRERTQEAACLYAEAVQRNKELAEINEQLRSTQMQLVQSEKLAAIGQLTAGIVHDVKNPLTVVKGMAELLLSEGNIPEDIREEITLIRDSSQKANVILTDLLTFARQSRPEMEERDMRETVEAALRLTAYPLRKAHIEMSKDLPNQAVMMTYDNQQIEQVLVNLINNAVHAMKDGGKLRINLSQAECAVAIAVEDTGIGIPPENLPRIFDPFFTTKPEGEGTGLGLSVSYGIISNHNGQFEVQSKVGEGTTFTILLPVNHVDDEGGKR